MLARLQQATTLGVFVAALIWIAGFIERPLVAAVGSLLIVFGYAIFLAAEFVLMARANRDDPAPPASPAQRLGAWLGEVATTPRVFYWRQPFRSSVEPDWLPADAARRGVVLVHGFVCNRGLWNPWMRRLRALGVPHVAVNLEPVFGSIDAYPRFIDDAVRRVHAATGRAPLVVAHSMGGLAVRAWQARTDRPVHHVVFIGSPHRGTRLARFALSPNTRQMRPGSAWLHDLAALEASRGRQRSTCFYSHCDNIVFPASTATLPGADNRHVAGTAHVHLAFVPEVFDEVLRRLEGPAGAD